MAFLILLEAQNATVLDSSYQLQILDLDWILTKMEEESNRL